MGDLERGGGRQRREEALPHGVQRGRAADTVCGASNHGENKQKCTSSFIFMLHCAKCFPFRKHNSVCERIVFELNSTLWKRGGGSRAQNV